MSTNLFRQQGKEYTNGPGTSMGVDEAAIADPVGQNLSSPEIREDSKSERPNAFAGLNSDAELRGYTSVSKGIPEHHTQVDQHGNPHTSHDQAYFQINGPQSQSFNNPFAVKPSNGTTLPSSTTSGQNGHQFLDVNNSVPSCTEAAQDLQLFGRSPEILMQPRHAHVPSFAQVRKEGLPTPRPTYARALSSHVTESEAPRMTAGKAQSEVIRRLGRAEKDVKLLKRRGSNESLSSLISYSVKRPSFSARPESAYSLDALAAVLEDVAQDGNLALVQAVMALGANPNFRSVNRIKNRRHDALNKATAAGHVDIIEHLLQQGATFNHGESQKKDAFAPIDYKLLDVAYCGYGDVARYLISNQGANPFVEQWPRKYYDANRTVYRRVSPMKVHQRTVLDALSRMGSPEQDTNLLKVIMTDPNFDPSAISTRIYSDIPYSGDGTRMVQITSHYSALSSFVKAGWADAIAMMLSVKPDAFTYQKPDTITFEEGQIPSSNIQRYIYPANAVTKDTWTYRPNDALRILHLLINHGFDMTTPQHTPDDSAPRTPLSRAILANASSAAELLLQAHPELVKTDVSFRLLLPGGEEREYVAQPLAASIIQGSLETAKVILRNGAHPSDPAFSYGNVLQFAAGHGGVTATALLRDMVVMAPDMLSEAIETAIQKTKPDSMDVLLSCTSARELGGLRLWDLVLMCQNTAKDDDIKRRYLQIIDLVHEADLKQKFSQEALKKAMEQGNIVGIERLLSLRVLESEEVRKWCAMMGKKGELDVMLRQYADGGEKGSW